MAFCSAYSLSGFRTQETGPFRSAAASGLSYLWPETKKLGSNGQGLDNLLLPQAAPLPPL